MKNRILDTVIGVLWAVAFVAAVGWGYKIFLDHQPVNSIRGHAYVVDGDTIKVTEMDYGNEVRIRLYGIDAPEWDQTCTKGNLTYACGKQAKRALLDLVIGHNVACQRLDTDRYRRMVAFCVLEDGEVDLGAVMVRQGWVVVYRRYAHIDPPRIEQYELYEQMARADRVGLWQGTFKEPEAYRHEGKPQ